MGTVGFGKRPLHTRTDVAWAATIRDVHAMPTETARGQSLEEGRAFAGSSPSPVRRLHIARGVVAQAGSIGEVLRPTDVRGIGILDEALPLLHRSSHHHGSASPRGVTLGIARGPAVNKGASMGRIGQKGAIL